MDNDDQLSKEKDATPTVSSSSGQATERPEKSEGGDGDGDGGYDKGKEVGKEAGKQKVKDYNWAIGIL